MKGDEGSVLVVDDNQVNRDLLARRLQCQGQPILDFGFWILDLLYSEVWSWEILDLRLSIEKQEKSECLLGKEETNG